MSESSGVRREAGVVSSTSMALVDAVAALLDDDIDTARHALDRAVAHSSWWTVINRLGVVGRALATDAELFNDAGVPDLDAGPPVELVEGGEKVLMATAWTGLEVVTRLVESGGYPPEVVL